MFDLHSHNFYMQCMFKEKEECVGVTNIYQTKIFPPQHLNLNAFQFQVHFAANGPYTYMMTVSRILSSTINHT